ncbi:MAG: chromosome segregation protein SMC [Methanobacteriota archaeon]|nr:MAG: chromosome segregation protein SMC [Euryarchaeota archaeon]
MVYIKEVQMKGFKLFGPKKTTLKFGTGLTVIAGPNGCGKTTIFDALCFVLGSISPKSLRARELSGLIYRGKEGSSPYAEVTVIFQTDGEENSEISITRRIGPDGKSVYRINGKRTTRNNVLDLLNDLNLTAESHNMIEQGEIKKFLEKNPVERRALIEEIAGVAEYEEKKEKALEELREAEEKINQHNILLSEIKKEVDKLKIERDHAIYHQELQEKLRVAKVSLLKCRIDKRKQKVDDYSKTISKLEDKREKTCEEILKYQEQFRNLKQREEEIEKQIDQYITREEKELQEKVSEKRNQLGRIEERIKELDLKLGEYKGKEEKLFKELGNTNSEISHLEKDIKRLDEEIEQGKKELRSAEMMRNKLIETLRKKDRDVANLQEKLGEIDKQINEKSLLIRKLELELASKTKNRENLYTQLKLEEEKKKQKDESVSRLLEEIRIYEEEIDEKKKLIRNLEKKSFDETKKTEMLAREIAKKNRERTNIKEKIMELRADLRSAQRRQLETGSKAVQSILKAKNQSKIAGVIGTISQLGVADQRYAVALEVAAGTRLQNIVVEDEDVACTCIEYLKKHGLGRATFLPLNKIRFGLDGPVRPPLPKGAIAYAIDLVKFDERYRPAFEYVFGNTVVVKNLETAKRIGIGSFRMVTLDGDLVARSGAMTGGSHTKKVVGAFLNVENIEKQLSEVEEELKTVEDAYTALVDEHEEAKRRVEAIKEEIKLVETEVQRLSLRADEMRKRVAERKKEVSEHEQTISRIVEEIRKLDDDIRTLNERKRCIEQEKDELSALYRDIAGKLEEKKIGDQRAEIDRIDIAIDQGRNKLQTLENRLNEKKVRLELLTQKRDTIKKELEELSGNIAATTHTLEELEEKKETLEKTIEKDVRELEKSFEKVDNLRKLRISTKNEIARAEQMIRELQETLSKIEEEKNRLSIERANVRTEINMLEEELLRYPSTPIPETIPGEKELENEITRLEKEIDRLGKTNLLAIEQYEEKKEYYEDILTKRNQVIREKEKILEYYEAIEKRKKDVFMETFNAIAKNFSEVYRSMSGGGDGRLLLENPENPFEGGLLIEAQPPKKVLRDIEVLSGGEKAFVALSLVFAIHDYKPAPFYMFDEADGDLDPENLEKALQHIKSRAATAQFIMISHNPKTLAAADRIYGVYLHRGTSKVISVDLSKTGELVPKKKEEAAMAT